MTFTLRAKLIAATVSALLMIAILVASVSYGSRALTEDLRQSQLATASIRNHTNADMMHDAIRADVYAALYTARADRGRQKKITAEFREHAGQLKAFIASNASLALPETVKETLNALDEPLSAYVLVAEALINSAFTDGQGAESALPGFEERFSQLEAGMDRAGDVIEAVAANEIRAADMFSKWAAWLSDTSLVASVGIAGFLLWVTHFDVLAPLAKLTAALRRLAAGDHMTALPTGRRDEIGQMARTIQTFGKDALEREKLTRETRVLSELNEWLQSAKSEPELYQMIAKFLSHFLPDCSGSIYIYANSRDILECAKVWNGPPGIANMHPDDCWGLRRGRTYTHGQNEIEFECAHVGAETAEEYCCIPILAHGETVGLLHLQYMPVSAGDVACRKLGFAEQRRLGSAAVEHISLAIANVKLRDQLRDQSIRDVLTGLFNRRYMLETSRREFQRAARTRQSITMLSIDVDHFKTFNDNHGHDAGDTVLRAVGEALSSSFRGDDVPCRFGGEEFVVMLPETSAEIAAGRAEELRAKIEALTVRYADANLPRITISVGVASYPEAGSSPMEVLKVADNALYAAKNNGRNRVELAGNVRTDVPESKALTPGPDLNDAILDRLGQSAHRAVAT